MEAPASTHHRHPQLLGPPYHVRGGRPLYGSGSKGQPLRAEEIHLGEQPFRLQGTMEKLLPPEAAEGTFHPGYQRSSEKLLLTPHPVFCASWDFPGISSQELTGRT